MADFGRNFLDTSKIIILWCLCFFSLHFLWNLEFSNKIEKNSQNARENCVITGRWIEAPNFSARWRHLTIREKKLAESNNSRACWFIEFWNWQNCKVLREDQLRWVGEFLGKVFFFALFAVFCEILAAKFAVFDLEGKFCKLFRSWSLLLNYFCLF